MCVDCLVGFWVIWTQLKNSYGIIGHRHVGQTYLKWIIYCSGKDYGVVVYGGVCVISKNLSRIKEQIGLFDCRELLSLVLSIQGTNSY